MSSVEPALLLAFAGLSLVLGIVGKSFLEELGRKAAEAIWAFVARRRSRKKDKGEQAFQVIEVTIRLEVPPGNADQASRILTEAITKSLEQTAVQALQERRQAPRSRRRRSQRRRRGRR